MPKALIINYPAWDSMFYSIGWEVISLMNPTPVEITDVLADPEVMAVIQQGHGGSVSFETGGGVVYASSYSAAMSQRATKPMFVYLEHCDAMNVGQDDPTNNTTWIGALSKGSYTGIAFVGYRNFDILPMPDVRMWRDMSEYISEGYTISEAYRLAMIAFSRAYDPVNDWGTIFRGDPTVRLTSYAPKPRAFIWKHLSESYTVNPWWINLTAAGYHVIWTNNADTDYLDGYFQNIMEQLSIEVYVGEGQWKYYGSDPYAGNSREVKVGGINADPALNTFMTASEVKAWLQGSPKLRFVYLEHSNSMVDVDPNGDNWVNTFSRGDLSDIVIVGGVGDAWMKDGSLYQGAAFAYDAWVSTFTYYLGSGYNLITAGGLASVQYPIAGVTFAGDGEFTLVNKEDIMYQFDTGSVHTAKVIMHNPTGTPYNYTGVLYMGIAQSTESEVDFQLNGGESKEITFNVTMPSTAGQYPVYIGVFSGGLLLGSLRQGEDVIVNVPVLQSSFTVVRTATKTQFETIVVPESFVISGTYIIGWDDPKWDYGKPHPNFVTITFQNISGAALECGFDLWAIDPVVEADPSLTGHYPDVASQLGPFWTNFGILAAGATINAQVGLTARFIDRIEGYSVYRVKTFYLGMVGSYPGYVEDSIIRISIPYIDNINWIPL